MLLDTNFQISISGYTLNLPPPRIPVASESLCWDSRNKKTTPSKFNSKNPWKMMVGRRSPFLLVWHKFSGQAVKLPRGTLLFPKLLLIFGVIRPQGSNTQCNPKEWDPHGRGQKWIWWFFSYIFLMEILNLALYAMYILVIYHMKKNNFKFSKYGHFPIYTLYGSHIFGKWYILFFRYLVCDRTPVADKGLIYTTRRVTSYDCISYHVLAQKRAHFSGVLCDWKIANRNHQFVEKSLPQSWQNSNSSSEEKEWIKTHIYIYIQVQVSRDIPWSFFPEKKNNMKRKAGSMYFFETKIMLLTSRTFWSSWRGHVVAYFFANRLTFHMKLSWVVGRKWSYPNNIK